MDNSISIEVISRKDDIKRRLFSLKQRTAPSMTVPMARIEIGSRIIPADPVVVALIKGSILQTGRLLTPLLVRQMDAKYVLIDGMNRYLALQQLGRSQTEAYVVGPADDDEAKAYEAIANCHRRPKLSALDRALNDAAYVKYVQQKVPQVAGPRGGRQPKEQFQKKTADELGVKPDQIRRSLKIAKISPYVQDLVRKYGLEGNQSVLLQIAASGDQEARQVSTLARHLKEITKGPSGHRRGEALESINDPQVPEGNVEGGCGPSSELKFGPSGERAAVPITPEGEPERPLVVERDQLESTAVASSDDDGSEQWKIIEHNWGEAHLLRQALHAATVEIRRRFFDQRVLPELFGRNSYLLAHSNEQNLQSQPLNRDLDLPTTQNREPRSL
ncbi:ParB N-terminal domain-containing protein [Bradyrhizobium sp. 62]|uniref:ParB/RepB/Spo0J family partition protein n=1 Tax=Bradyrhizobium sp. 62 TaxID=1043588 RepID=UPI001FF83FEC|nr:ParB N-terminal domain-containing protein [Bradyrhizobium sp. 62]MCK1364069.1 ParB N-terminal domain-containing protein [Bradyrhizobium sp. 62]